MPYIGVNLDALTYDAVTDKAREDGSRAAVIRNALTGYLVPSPNPATWAELEGTWDEQTKPWSDL